MLFFLQKKKLCWSFLELNFAESLNQPQRQNMYIKGNLLVHSSHFIKVKKVIIIKKMGAGICKWLRDFNTGFHLCS